MEIIQDKGFYGNNFFSTTRNALDTNRGVFRKEQTKGYVILDITVDVTNVDYMWMSLKKKTYNTHV